MNDEFYQPDDEDIIINAIRLNAHELNEEQVRDENIQFMVALKRYELDKHQKPIIKEFLNKEQEIYYKQWNRLYLIGKSLFRIFQEEDDTIRFRYIVPAHQRESLLKQAHGNLCSGHLGFEKTRDRLIRKFYWPNQIQDIENYVRSCLSCQQNKHPKNTNYAELLPLLPTRPLELVTSDIMGPLPTSKSGNSFIMVVCDHFTKFVEIFALNRIQTVDIAPKLLEFICRHGIPETILTDQGTNYQHEIMNEIWELLDVHKVRNSPLHPSCDGLSERFNRTLRSMMCHYVNEQQDNWDQSLPMLQFAYNTATHSTTKATPFELMYGRPPTVPLDLMFSHEKVELYLTPAGYAENLQSVFHLAYNAVIQCRDVAMNRNKIRVDRKVRACNMDIGDFVWLIDPTTKKGVSKKFKKRWIGPYQILSKPSAVNYEIKPIKSKGKKLTVHQSRLKRCYLP